MRRPRAPGGRRFSAPTGRQLAAIVAGCLACGAALAEKPVFKHPFDGAPVELPLKPGEKETPALAAFKETGENAYRGKADAIAEGKKLYDEWCQVCHNSDATGKMGPSLVGKSHVYPQTANDVGMFAILNTGASGAMQSFTGRITQDDMLKVIAYVRSRENN
jgi:cytochrome c-L